MKYLSLVAFLFSFNLLISCAATHKSGIPAESIPTTVHEGKYKLLVTEINFENTVTDRVAEIHNNAARKHVLKKMGDENLFIRESDLNKKAFVNKEVYRFVLLNRITKEITKSYYRESNSTGPIPTGSFKNYVTEFFIMDRVTGKEYPHVKGTTMPLYMLKAIVDKIAAS